MRCLLGRGNSKSPLISSGSIQENELERPVENDQIKRAYAKILTILFNELNVYLDRRKNQLQSRWRRLFIRKKLTEYRIDRIAQPLQTSLTQYFPPSKNKNVRYSSRNSIRFTENDFISPKNLLPLREFREQLTDKIASNNTETRKYIFCTRKGKLQKTMQVALRNLSAIPDIPDETLNSDSDSDSMSFLSDKSIDLK